MHTLRHTYATTALSNGVPMHVVSRNLGHSSIMITADIYGHLTDDAAGQPRWSSRTLSTCDAVKVLIDSIVISCGGRSHLADLGISNESALFRGSSVKS